MQGIKHFFSITEGNSPTRQSQNIFKESTLTKIQEQSLNYKLDHSWNNYVTTYAPRTCKNFPNLNFNYRKKTFS